MNSNGTILYIGGFELPDKNAAAHRVINNAKILDRLGYNVILVGVSRDPAIDMYILPTKKKIFQFDSYEVKYPRNTAEWIKAMTNIAPYKEIIKGDNSIVSVICYNFHSFAFEKIRKYCKSKKIKCYGDVTEWYSSANEKSVIKLIKSFDTWYRMTVIQKRLDGLIVISRYLQNYYLKCKNVVYIQSLADVTQEKWSNPNTKNKEVLQMVYAGNPGEKDRIDYLIKALATVSRLYRLDIIGISKEQYLKYYPLDQALAENKNILFHGRLPHLETLDFVKKANYSCFFREDDRVSRAGFPTKLAEALSCGTPVLTNETSNIREYITNDCNGIIVGELSTECISKTIEALPLVMPINNQLLHYEAFIKNMRGLFNNE